VGVAAAICLLGTLTTFLLLDRATHREEAYRVGWIGAAGIATGTSTWATHFLAMLAYDGGTPIGFGLGLTISSAFIGIVMSLLGYRLACSRPTLTRLAMGGAVVGLGVGLMHFTGMAAIEAPAHQHYHPLDVAVALFGGAALAAAATAVFGSMHKSIRIFAGALLLTLSICTLHFVSMGALTLVPDPGVSFNVVPHDKTWLAFAVTTAVILLLMLAIGTAIIDRRMAFQVAETRRFRSLADASAEGILIARGADIIDMNERMRALLNEPEASFAHRSVIELLPQLDIEALAAESQLLAEMELVLGEGDTIPVEVISREIQHHGAPARVIVVRDLRERQAAKARIAYMAHHDPLTGLPNRALLNDRLRQALARSRRTGDKLAVLCLDLDRFKAVNDVYGHSAGDEVLRKVTSTLQSVTREEDTIARLGGDEFVILQTEVPQPEGARALASRLIEAFDATFGPGSGNPSVGVSIGIALSSDEDKDADAILGHGDTALYRAKNEGRGTWRFFEAGMDQALRERRLLEQELRIAVSEEQFYLDYQPQVAAESEEIIGFEALLRWRHPSRGVIQPDEFIPITEESGLIAQLGLWVLREAATEAASWQQPLRIAINLSPMQFYQADLAQKIEALLAETGLAPNRLELEITETALLRDRDAVLKVLHHLKSLGVHIAMDDFGTGYSSLSNLQCFPFDKIKIDKSFIATLDSDPAAMSIIRAVIGLGRGFSLPIVAEGVETERQRELLRQEMCTELQGFLFGRPQPMGAFPGVTGDRSKAA
jgi:diguanylate cyclase (GGDEF)-like protein